VGRGGTLPLVFALLLGFVVCFVGAGGILSAKSISHRSEHFCNFPDFSPKGTSHRSEHFRNFPIFSQEKIFFSRKKSKKNISWKKNRRKKSAKTV
jgi:hypothetical protein